MRLLSRVTVLVASTGLVLALGGPVRAQSSSAAASGPNASASASAGSSTSGPCRVITPEEAARGQQLGSSVNTGPGGLSGTVTVGPGGPRVTMGPGGGTAQGSTGSGGQAHASASSECVIVAPR